MRDVVAVYRDHLLATSEAFVLGQGENLARHEAVYVGSKRVPGVEVPAARTIAVSDGSVLGRLAEIAFKVTGRAPAMERALRRRGPALVHAHFAVDGALVLPLARRLGVPLVVTCHGYDVMIRDELARRGHFLQRRFIRGRAELQGSGAHFVAVSQFLRDRMIEQGYPEDRVRVLYIGVDTGRFTVPAARRREDVVLFVGRLAPEKGADVALRAMARVQAQRPATEFVLLGYGSERPALEALAARLGVRARFLGRQPHAVVSEWMSRASLFLGASQAMPNGWSEAFGLVFLEAQASGLPVVATANGGIPEAVRHGETGLLAAPRDDAALAAHLLALLEDEPRRQRMAEAGRRRAVAEFDIRRRTAALEELYREAIEEHAAAARPRRPRPTFAPGARHRIQPARPFAGAVRRDGT